MLDPIQQSCSPIQSPMYIIMTNFQPQNKRIGLKDDIRRMPSLQKKVMEEMSKEAEGDCRICLEGERVGKLERYCKCSGTAEFAHENCISQWIMRKEQEYKRVVRCQICHQAFNYNIMKRTELACEDFLLHWNSKRVQILLFCLAILLSICGLALFINAVFGAEMYLPTLREKMTASKVVFMGILVAIIIWFFIIVIVLYVFTSKFLMRNIKIIELDKANSLRFMRLAKSIKQSLSYKTAASSSC